MSIWDLFKRPIPPKPHVKVKQYKCIRCQTERPKNEFNKHKYRGLQPWCRDCHKKYNADKKGKKNVRLIPVIQARTLERKTVSFCIKNVPIEARLELQKIAERHKIPMGQIGLNMIKDFITLHSKN
jgi:NAD-dependent SIR2 family protein deacetylase